LTFAGCAICYASANIKALETLGYAEYICNYVVILDSWLSGKKYVAGTRSNLVLIFEQIAIFFRNPDFYNLSLPV